MESIELEETLSDVYTSPPGPFFPDNITTEGPLIIPYGELWTPTVIQRTATLGVVMVLALIGNSIILITLTCSRYRVRTGRPSCRVNIFILNLAVGDLTVCLVTMPAELVFGFFGEWVLGEAACKMIVYGEIVALASTIFILLAMTYDRYLAICQPLRFKNSMARARRTIILAWVLALSIALPQLFIFVQVQEGVHPDGQPVYTCKSGGYTAYWQRRLYFSCLTVFILLLPAAIITFCYVNIVRVVWRQGKQQTVVASSASVISLRKTGANDRQLSRAKVRTIKLTLFIIVAFVACWTPYFVVHNLRIHSYYEYRVAEPVKVFAETIALFNSALNPIVYGCFNLRVKKALHDSCCVGRPRSAAGLILGSNHSGHARIPPASDCSSSYAEETVVNTASSSCSPSSSAKLRVHPNRVNGLIQAVNCAGELVELKRNSSCRRSGKEMYELKRRPASQGRGSRS